jgi:putative chitinase
MIESQLKLILPRCDAAAFIEPSNDTFSAFAINTPLRQAAFLATIGEESSQLTVFEENLNYRHDALLKLFGSHFTSMNDALAYARQPERIANRVYANRGGNGDEASGDGWRFRGMGGIQLMFHDNQKACADYFDIPLGNIQEWLRTRVGAVRSAGWFWWLRHLNDYADAGDFDGVSDVVNRGRKTAVIGDSNGWPERLALYTKAKEVLGC